MTQTDLLIVGVLVVCCVIAPLGVWAWKKKSGGR